MDDVHAALGELRPGQRVEVELERDGKPVKGPCSSASAPAARPPSRPSPHPTPTMSG